MVITIDGSRHTFDCFECAIQALAPGCAHCGCAIIGHGMEMNGLFYCCAHCARHADAPALSEQDNAAAKPASTENMP